MSKKHSFVGVILLIVAAIFLASAVFLEYNIVRPMWDYQHQYLTNGFIYSTFAFICKLIGIVALFIGIRFLSKGLGGALMLAFAACFLGVAGFWAYNVAQMSMQNSSFLVTVYTVFGAFNTAIGIVALFYGIRLIRRRNEAESDRHMGMKASKMLTNGIIYLLLVIISVVWLFPFFCIVVNSFRDDPVYTMNTSHLFYNANRNTGYHWGFGNYVRLFVEQKTAEDGTMVTQNTFKTNGFLRWYANTFIIAIVVAIVQTIIVLCMSYALSRFRFKLRKPLMQFMLILGMFPGMLSLIILYQVLKDIGLTGPTALPGLILVYVASSGMGYYVSKGFFDTIPKSLDEAARIDGATRAQVLIRIILPLAKPIVIYTVLTAFMGPWADFVFARYVTGVTPEAWNVAVGLQWWMSSQQNISQNYTLFCAGGVVVAIPVVILFMCLQRYYVEGVTGGAVKG
jgi:arabinogalactan oligomer/maltooligosaccharide transport system permease protein